MNPASLPRYVDEREAARVLGVSRGTLSNWRTLRRGPAYVRIGRAIRYSLADIVAFAEAGRISPDAAPPRRGRPAGCETEGLG